MFSYIVDARLPTSCSFRCAAITSSTCLQQNKLLKDYSNKNTEAPTGAYTNSSWKSIPIGPLAQHAVQNSIFICSIAVHTLSSTLVLRKYMCKFLSFIFTTLHECWMRVLNQNLIWQGSFRLFTRDWKSCFSFFLEGQVVVTYCIPACVFLISQYGESVSIIILSTGTPLMTSKFSIVLSEQPLIPALHHTPQSQCPQNVTGSLWWSASTI